MNHDPSGIRHAGFIPKSTVPNHELNDFSPSCRNNKHASSFSSLINSMMYGYIHICCPEQVVTTAFRVTTHLDRKVTTHLDLASHQGT